jgi:hypothetical protein
MNVNKPTRTKSQLEALILEKARSLDLASVVRAVTVRPLRQNLAEANWVVVSMNASGAGVPAQQVALRQIVPGIRAQFDLEE